MTIAPLIASALLLIRPSPPAPDRAPAPAPPSGPHGYVVATVAFAHHPADAAHYRSFITSVGGSGWDVSGGGGVSVSSTLAIEGELVYGGTISTPQFTFYTEQARDILLNAVLRYHPTAMSRLALVGGGGYAWTRTSEDPVQGSRPPLWWHGATLTGGVDVTILDGAHAALAPSFRVRWVNRADALDGWNGLGALTFQFGASVFIR